MGSGKNKIVVFHIRVTNGVDNRGYDGIIAYDVNPFIRDNTTDIAMQYRALKEELRSSIGWKNCAANEIVIDSLTLIT
jgi:hypothetical protein